MEDSFTLQNIFFHIIYFSGVRVHCPGKPGHGSRFIEDNAAEKFVSFFYDDHSR